MHYPKLVRANTKNLITDKEKTVFTLDGTGEGQQIVSFAFESFSTNSVFSLYKNGKNEIIEMFHDYRTREPTRGNNNT